MRPEDAGIGAAPESRASLASLAKRAMPAISPISLAAISVPQPGSAASRGATAVTSAASSCSRSVIARVSSRTRLSSSRATRTRADCSLRARRRARRCCQRRPVSARDGISSSGPEVVQLPAQIVDQRGALLDEPIAVIDEQPDVELGAGQLRDRQRLETLADRRAGDRDGVDAIGLSRLAGALPGAGHQLRRNADDALAALEQEPLQRPRHMPAVFKRPDPLAADAARPAQQLTERPRRRGNRHLAKCPARRLVDGRKRVRPLMRVRPDHDHFHRPLVGMPSTDPRWTQLSRGDATLLSSHARDPRTAAGDTTKEGQTNGRQHGKESARRRPRTLPATPDTTAPDELSLSLTWKATCRTD